MTKVIVPPKYSSQSVIIEVDQLRGEGKPETFPFLGFTHFCGQRIRDGAFIVWRITRRSGWSRSSKPSRLNSTPEASSHGRGRCMASEGCAGLLLIQAVPVGISNGRPYRNHWR